MNFKGSFSFAAEYVIEVSSLFARQGHVADGDRSKGGGVIFYWSAGKRKNQSGKGGTTGS